MPAAGPGGAPDSGLGDVSGRTGSKGHMEAASAPSHRAHARVGSCRDARRVRRGRRLEPAIPRRGRRGGRKGGGVRQGDRVAGGQDGGDECRARLRDQEDGQITPPRSPSATEGSGGSSPTRPRGTTTRGWPQAAGATTATTSRRGAARVAPSTAGVGPLGAARPASGGEAAGQERRSPGPDMQDRGEQARRGLFPPGAPAAAARASQRPACPQSRSLSLGGSSPRAKT